MLILLVVKLLHVTLFTVLTHNNNADYIQDVDQNTEYHFEFVIPPNTNVHLSPFSCLITFYCTTYCFCDSNIGSGGGACASSWLGWVRIKLVWLVINNTCWWS